MGESAMVTMSDYFFGSYVPPQEQRLRFVARNGVAHASEISPRDPLPDQPVTLAITTDAALPIDRVAVYYTTDGSDPSGAGGHAERGQVALASATGAVVELPDATRIRRWRAILPGQPDGALVRYRIDAWSSADPGQRWLADAVDPIGPPAAAGREFTYHVDRRVAPDWVHDAIVYHIFVDRFAAASDQAPIRAENGLTDFNGGTIRGISEKLDYLADLGVNCLWLSPVMDSPTYHGYNPTSYHEISRRFGSNDDLRELVAAMHARGMRIVLDFVANHTSNEHPAFLAARQGAAPEVDAWYTFEPGYPNGYLSFFNVEGMPVLTTDAPAVRDYLFDAASSWLTDFKADGLRLDNVSGPTHAFWTLFQESVKDAAPHALTLGEITGGMPDISTYAGRLDACMDFPLTKEMRRVFALRDASLDDLLRALEAHEAAFPARMTPARLLDNHDMHRFLWLAEDDTRRLKLALAFLISLTGFPIVYYGTEVGLSQRAGPVGQDAYSREPMPWDSGQRVDVLERVRWLIARRRERVSLRRGQLARLALAVTGEAPEQVGALARWHSEEATIIAFNNGEHPARFTIDPLGMPFSPRLEGARGSLLTPEGVTPLADVTPQQLAGVLPPMSAIMLFLDVASADA
jgi:hypothetical protein